MSLHPTWQLLRPLTHASGQSQGLGEQQTGIIVRTSSLDGFHHGPLIADHPDLPCRSYLLK
eukprot:750325-Hanusia_phi.AAC.1